MRLEAPRPATAGLHLAVLTSFAIAQPIFDLLGRNGEFFGARGSTRWEIVVFALSLVIVPPALLLAVEAVMPRSAREIVHTAFVAALVGLFVLQLVRDADWPGARLVALAAAVGVLAAWAYARIDSAQRVLTALAPAPLIFVALFLFHSDASRLTLSGSGTAFAAAAALRVPVVVVVFDELPVNSLLDRKRRVDPIRFPRFAALARGSTWFRNESVVSEGTLHGVPALLTGRYPRLGELPVYHDHPQNLFTLLGGGPEHVVETETHLCPPKLCRESSDSFASRLGSLYSDAGVVYLHELLSDDLAGGIPSISHGWQSFWRNGDNSDPEQRFRSFLATVRPGPGLSYVHVLLPHSPWRFLPSGKRYSIRPAPGWSAAEVWTDNQAAVDQYWQRHLLQLAFTDRLLGELVARLRSTGLYDRSLLVVTADEGLSFRAGEKRRPASDANLPDIAYVPLFVKMPHQRRGVVVNAPVQSVDVLPMIAAAAGVRIPWRVDGVPRPRRPNVLLFKDGGKRFDVPAAELEGRREAALDRQLSLFGSDEPPEGLFGLGQNRKLLGRRLRSFRLTAGRLRADVDRIDRTSPLVQVSGSIDGGSAHDVAVVAGGRVVAVAPVADGRFWALVPRAALGRHELRIYVVEGPGPSRLRSR